MGKRQWGYLRETRKKAFKANEKFPNTLKTGLEDYLEVIFPDIDDWINNNEIPEIRKSLGKGFRPDWRSERLHLIIEVDDASHYTNHVVIAHDAEKDRIYKEFGYNVIHIPYFIQLTNNVVYELFGVNVKEPLFDPSVASMSVYWPYSIPKPLCDSGILRMAQDLLMFPEQMKVNMEKLRLDAQEEPKRERKAKIFYKKLNEAINKLKDAE